MRGLLFEFIEQSKRGALVGTAIGGCILTLLAGFGIKGLVSRDPPTQAEVADTMVKVIDAGSDALLEKFGQMIEQKLAIYDAGLRADSAALMDSIGIPLMANVVQLRRDMVQVKKQLKLTSEKVDARAEPMERQLDQITDRIEERDKDMRVLGALARLEQRMDRDERARQAEMLLLKEAMRKKGMKIDF